MMDETELSMESEARHGAKHEELANSDSYDSNDDLLDTPETEGEKRLSFLTEDTIPKTVLHADVYSKGYKFFRTVFVVSGHLALGVYLEMTGPTMQEIMARTGTDYEQIGRALMTRSIGYVISSLASGILTDIFSNYVEVIVGISYLFGCVGTLFTPWATDLTQYALLNLIQGLGMGTSDVCQNLLILRIWADKAAPPMYAVHMGFGIGAFIAPQLAKPFLSTGRVVSANLTTLKGEYITLTNVTQATSYNTTHALIGASQIEIPYSVAAIFVLLIGIINFSIYAFERVRFRNSLFGVLVAKKRTPEKEMPISKRIIEGFKIFSPGTCTGGNITFGLFFFFFLFIYFANVVGSERAISKFLFSYSKETNVSFSNSQAANLNSVFWFSFMGGRFLGIIVSFFLPAQIFIIILLILLTTSSAVLTALGTSVSAVLWSCSGLYGVAVGPLFPALAGWSNLYVEMKGLAISLMTVGAAVGAMVFQWVTGYLFEYHGPETLMKVLLASAVITSFVFACLLGSALRQGKRFSGKASKEENIEVK